jgi:serine/threonine-protein kinase
LTVPPDVLPRREAATSGPIAAGTVVEGRFVLGSIIGQGASGTVYSAVDQKSGEGVALKFIHRHLLTDRQVQRRFYREASILRRLRSEHLIGLRAFGEHDGLLYMALDLSLGASLEALTLNKRPFSTERAVRIVLQVCEALEAAHAAEVIHRDLKPSNVMVDAAPDGGDCVRVLDFGMAKVLQGEGTGGTVLTEKNMVFGTPEYMSPEQARGDDLDEACDIYAAGVILYELLTGSVPLVGSNPIATMTAHLVEPIEPPSSRAPQQAIPPALEAVVMCALQKNADDRYPSATALRLALSHALAHPEDTVSVRPSGQRARSSRQGAAKRSLLPSFRAPASASDGPVLGTLGWVLVAVVAAGAGIGIGIWISLR